MNNTIELKISSKKQQKMSSLRISFETQKKLDRVLNSANKKASGRKIRADQVLNLAIDLVAEGHIKLLQERSLTNEDRQEILRQRYVEVRGQISRDEFIGFMLSGEYPKFLEEHQACFKVAQIEK